MDTIKRQEKTSPCGQITQVLLFNDFTEHHIGSNVNHSHVTCYILGTCLSYNWMFLPFDHLPPIPLPCTPCLLQPHIFFFFSMNLLGFFLMVNILSFADYLVSVWTIQPCHCNVGSYISYANKWALLCSNKPLFTKTCSKDLTGWPLSASSHHYPQELYPSPCKSLEKQLFDFIQLVHKQRYIAFDEVVI